MSLTRPQACRAWCNFNGTGTVAIRDSFNVSSITDNGVGWYTVNFTQNMPDANYSPAITGQVGTSTSNTSLYLHGIRNGVALSVSSVDIQFASVIGSGAAGFDMEAVAVAIFGDAS